MGCKSPFFKIIKNTIMFDSNKYRFDKGYELGKKHGKTINISLGVIIGYGIGFFLICLKYL